MFNHLINQPLVFLPLFGESHVSWAVTALFGVLLIGLIVCLALEEKLHAKKSLIAGVFAIICLLLGSMTGVLSFEKVLIGTTEVVPVASEIELLVKQGDNPEKIRIYSEPESFKEHETLEGQEDPANGPQAEDQPLDESGKEPSEDHRLFLDGEQVAMPVYIPGIDWGVIAIIFGSSLFVDVTSKSGLFSWIAIKVTKASIGDPVRLLYFYGIMTVVFSAVLNNVTAMIIVGSLTVVSLEKLEKRNLLLGFLLIEGLLTNIGGLLTLISSVPNIIVGSAAEISFASFFVKSAPYVVVATVVTLILGARIFGIRRLQTPEEKNQAKLLVDSFDENDSVSSPSFFWFSAAILVLFILTIAFTSVIPVIKDLGMGFVALAFAAVMLIRFRSEVNRFYSAIDWDLLGFFMALFATIYVLEHANVLNTIGMGIKSVMRNITDPAGDRLDSVTLLIGSAGFSSVTDNIPLAAMLAKILQSLGTPTSSTLWWSVIFGANLGGNLTPIGSASTLVAITIMHKHKLKMSFGGFVKVAFLFAFVQIVLALLYILFVIGNGYV